MSRGSKVMGWSVGGLAHEITPIELDNKRSLQVVQKFEIIY